MTPAEREVLDASRAFAQARRDQARSPLDAREVSRRYHALRRARERWERACFNAFGIQPWSGLSAEPDFKG